MLRVGGGKYAKVFSDDKREDYLSNRYDSDNIASIVHFTGLCANFCLCEYLQSVFTFFYFYRFCIRISKQKFREN